jgi:hypothetical protein
MVLHIYAEHLVHIRTLSIQASLASASNSSTRALICADGKTVLLTHTGENARLVLPACVPASLADTELRISQYASKDINFRIPLGDSANGPSDAEQPKHSILGDYDNTTPWSARVLNSNVQISCLQCQTIVAERGSIKLWKDLPSENWAEMMDFWHCHRPHVPHDAQGALKKGYAADSKLALVPSVGMVDHSHFVLHPHDCRNLEVGLLICSRSVAGKLYVCVLCVYVWLCACFSILLSLNIPSRARKNRPFQTSTSPSREGSGYKCPRTMGPRKRIFSTSPRGRSVIVISWSLKLYTFHRPVIRPMDSTRDISCRYMTRNSNSSFL